MDGFVDVVSVLTGVDVVVVVVVLIDEFLLVFVVVHRSILVVVSFDKAAFPLRLRILRLSVLNREDLCCCCNKPDE